MFSLLQHGSASLRKLVTFFFWVTIAQAELKDVFFHYMVTGITASEATLDIQQAKALGVDAFALNLQSVTEPWSLAAVETLFSAANDNDFKLFFSFDMTWFTDPAQFLPYIVYYIANPAYYMHDNLPFVSTFDGGMMTFGESTPNEGWQVHYIDALAVLGHETYFIPSFSDAAEANGVDFFEAFPSVNGALNWNCWPEADSTNITTTIDLNYLSTRPAGTIKQQTYMMGFSPFQFKHLSPSENWYLAGTSNVFDRISQVLELSPDFVEIISRNDNGEGHYFGNIWEDSDPASYTLGYNHTGWTAFVPAMIKAYKSGDPSDLVPTNGETIQGAFWHHTLTSYGNCDADSLGKPSGYQVIEDLVSVGLFASSAAASDKPTLNAWSGSTMIGSETVEPGFNKWTFPMGLGKQSVEVVDSNGNVLYAGLGAIDTVDQSDMCNYNFQVVEITAASGTAKRDLELERRKEEKEESGLKAVRSHMQRHKEKRRAARLL